MGKHEKDKAAQKLSDKARKDFEKEVLKHEGRKGLRDFKQAKGKHEKK